MKTYTLIIRGLCVASALLFAGGTLLGQNAIQINGTDVAADAEDESGDASAPYVIFSNLGSRDNVL